MIHISQILIWVYENAYNPSIIPSTYRRQSKKRTKFTRMLGGQTSRRIDTIRQNMNHFYLNTCHISIAPNTVSIFSVILNLFTKKAEICYRAPKQLIEEPVNAIFTSEVRLT